MRALDLKPTNDAVFKMMFTHGPDAERALIGLLTAVLRPRSPITSVVVENPDLPPDLIGEKRIVLDIEVRLQDGSRCDVEMQTTREAAFPERTTLYGARLYSEQLTSGAEYSAICPVVVVVFLACDDSRFQRFHASYRMREDANGKVLTNSLVTHIISLPRSATATDARRPREAKLLRWSKLLSATTLEEVASAAGDDPAMLKAAAVLDRLQDDPKAREIARARELARQWAPIEAAAQRAEGREEGLQAGREEGLRRAVFALCRALDIGVPADGARTVGAMDADALEQLLATIGTSRSWPR